MAKETAQRKLVAENRRARFNYEIAETFEAGLALQGTEVKSLRQGKANIGDAYAGPSGDELFLFNVHIPEYLEANRFNHETRRPRKLLLHRREINRLLGKLEAKGLTVVPLDIHLKGRRAKVKLGLARGKKLFDKREATAERDANRQIERVLKERRYRDE